MGVDPHSGSLTSRGHSLYRLGHLEVCDVFLLTQRNQGGVGEGTAAVWRSPTQHHSDPIGASGQNYFNRMFGIVRIC